MSPPNILLYADVHGRIPLLLKLAWRFQRERECTLDLILVVGDLGVWPDLQRLDSATRRFAHKDPAELGFLAFGSLQSQTEREESQGTDAASILQEKPHSAHQRKARRVVEACLDGPDPVTCPIVFIGGNHEDYVYLNQCRDRVAEDETLVPIDQTGHLHWLPTGRCFGHSGLTIGGIDGIEAEASGRSSARYHPDIRVDDDKALCLLEALTTKHIDVLLTHDGPPKVAHPDRGSPLFQTLLEEIQPTYHFFGHYHSRAPGVSYRSLYGGFSRTNTIGTHINKLGFDKQDRLRPQSLLHLSDAPRFVRDPWLAEVRRNNWHHTR